MYEISLFPIGSTAAQTRNAPSYQTPNIEILAEQITQRPWAPAVFKDHIRANANLESIQLLVLDVDEGCPLADALVYFKEYKHIIGTSKSHGIEKNGVIRDRFRVILFLDSPATTDMEFKEYWFAAFAKWPFIDKACKDSARFFFPCKEIVSIQANGALFDVRVKADAAKPYANGIQSTGKSIQSLPRKGELSKLTMDFLINGSPDGTWHPRFFKAAKDLQEKGYSMEDAYERFLKIRGVLDDKDISRLEDVYLNRTPKYPITETAIATQALRELILASKFIVNVSDPDEAVLFNQNTGTVYDIKKLVVMQLLGRGDFALYQSTNVIYAKFIYDRFLKSPLLIEESSGVQIYNTYVPPQWAAANYYFGAPLTGMPNELPEIYDAFFTHLTNGHVDSKNYLLDWLSNAINSRNFTVLTAIGEEGVGKGVLGEIMERIFGESNFTAVRDEIFKNKFNGQLRNKALVYIDEVRLRDEEDHNRLKAVVNNKIEVERKGKDAELLRNQASFYLSSNHQDAIRLSGTDRRFSIIQMTDKKLLETPLIGRIDELLAKENIEQLGLFLLNRVITHTMTIPFTSSRKDDVMEASLYDWEYFVVFEWSPENVGKTISLNDLKMKIQTHLGAYKRAPGRNRILDLVKKYPKYLKAGQKHGTNERWVTVIGASTEPAPKLRSPSLTGST